MNPVNLQLLRSALFVPLADERFLAKAHQRGADALLLDLEDSVPPAQKAAARARLPEAARRLAALGATVMVRVNSAPEHLAEDLKAAAQSAVVAIFLPKVESPEQVAAAEYLLEKSTAKLVAMLESPAAVLEATAISRTATRLAGLVFGSEDYCGLLGIDSSKAALEWPAQMVATAARARDLAAFGLPGPVSEITNMEAFTKLLEKAQAMGFTGCTCIHPRQVEAANRVYSPSTEEITLAQEIVTAFEAALREGRGAFALHGRMIDAPVVDQARATLARIR
ncbi:MAG: CoA ester lyase [Betaproteobacteria bacterium]|nr:CoA ester lyase [Betaproteobacteria bacterium]MSQ88423.1 CoA ester lyase [Betaproteobacteria bacterium]